MVRWCRAGALNHRLTATNPEPWFTVCHRNPLRVVECGARLCEAPLSLRKTLDRSYSPTARNQTSDCKQPSLKAVEDHESKPNSRSQTKSSLLWDLFPNLQPLDFSLSVAYLLHRKTKAHRDGARTRSRDDCATHRLTGSHVQTNHSLQVAGEKTSTGDCQGPPAFTSFQDLSLSQETVLFGRRLDHAQ